MRRMESSNLRKNAPSVMTSVKRTVQIKERMENVARKMQIKNKSNLSAA